MSHIVTHISIISNDSMACIVAKQESRRQSHPGSSDFSHPSSAWARTAGKLCFPCSINGLWRLPNTASPTTRGWWGKTWGPKRSLGPRCC